MSPKAEQWSVDSKSARQRVSESARQQVSFGGLGFVVSHPFHNEREKDGATHLFGYFKGGRLRNARSSLSVILQGRCPGHLPDAQTVEGVVDVELKFDIHRR
jgi:hypothetical protein